MWWERKDEAREGRERRERGCAGGSERWSEPERERKGGWIEWDVGRKEGSDG